MRAVLCLLSVCIIASFLINTVSAVTFDGVIEPKEWYDEPFCDIIKIGTESNCYVNYASMYYRVDKDDYSVYLAFIYTSEDFNPENNHSAVEIYTNGIYSAKLYADGRKDINYDKFDAECVFGFHEKYMETYCEARLGIKYGIEDTTVLGIRIYDYLGRPSNYYELTICEPPETSLIETEAETKKEEKTKKETTTTETTVPAKSLSEYESTLAPRGSAQVQGLRAETATMPQRETETTVATTTAEQSTTENRTETTQTTTERAETTRAETVKEAVSEDTATTEVLAVLSQEEVDRVNKKKLIGYGAATFMMLCAMIVTAVLITVRIVGKKNGEQPTDDF
ncbi:MAG: hypothetical protein IJB86_04900 [Clostridia bacterium]|nr:hypothetical protein [Clostridia bacterium]